MDIGTTQSTEDNLSVHGLQIIWGEMLSVSVPVADELLCETVDIMNYVHTS